MSHFADELAELSDRDTDLYRIDPNRRLAEDHAAGIRSGEFLDEYAPMTFHPLAERPHSPTRANELTDPDLRDAA